MLGHSEGKFIGGMDGLDREVGCDRPQGSKLCLN